MAWDISAELQSMSVAEHRPHSRRLAGMNHKSIGMWSLWQKVTPAVLSFLCIAARVSVSAAESDATALGKSYPSEILPLVEHYCHDCHGAADLVEGDINLAAMANWDEARKHPQTWQKVAEMLANRLMPPEDAEQPTEGERARLQKWVGDYLMIEARASAGDPGQVVLRRLNNAEYSYTLRDLTGVHSLDPAREFPTDGAAGEGFTNTGSALVMSPALVTKYLEAAKDVASHAVLLPEGFRFSPHTTARDWTDDTLAQIRDFYGQFTDSGGGSQVNLQGVVFDTNQGGRLPLEKYLAATLAEREALTSGRTTIDAVAREHGLNAKYLGILWTKLNGKQPSLLLDELRARWRTANRTDAAALADEVAAWQKSLWSFASVGLIGREGGPKRWMEPVDPSTTKQEIKFKIPESTDGKDITISLVAMDAGDGNDGDFVLWQSPRLVTPGRQDLLLRDVRDVSRELTMRRHQLFAGTAAYLNAADEVTSSNEVLGVPKVATKHGVEEAELRAWLDYLGIGAGGAVELEGHLTNKLTGIGGYEFVNGWGSNDTPSLAANSSDTQVRIPGNVKPHGVVVHPSPTLRAAVGWRSPIAATVRVEGAVTPAHPECGNGVTWSLELRRGATRQRLADGMAQGAAEVKVGPFGGIVVRAGDVVSLSIGPRDGNHACDLTAIDWKITDEQGDDERTWSLGDDVAGDVLAGNPHADRFGNEGVWHFYTEPDIGGEVGPVIPAESVLARWQAAKGAEQRRALANDVQILLTNGPPAANDDPDAALYRQLASIRGPLLGGLHVSAAKTDASQSTKPEFGLDPAMFGRHPNRREIDSADLCVQAPSVIEIRLPADLAAGCELVMTGVLDDETGREGSVQLAVVAGKLVLETGLLRGENKVTVEKRQWSANNQTVANSAPILVTEGSEAQRTVRAAFEEFRQLFPAALCYTKIVPVDEVISVTLFYREDDHLVRLMLDESQRQQLDELWNELHFVSRDALASVDAFAQLLEFATQDADPKVFEPLRQPINDRAAAFQRLLIECEPKQVEALIDFAGRAYRRPLTTEEASDFRALYDRLRKEEIPHEDAFRLTLARVLVGPAFLYRIEKPVPGAVQGPVTDWELASRLSYFLWSSQPDAELRQVAASGRLREPEVLASQARRMLRDEKTRRLATEFACQWLHINDFENLDEKSERHFPTFVQLRGAMAEESILFFTDLFQHGGSVLDILDADYTFLNEELARHYGIPGVTGSEWRRVNAVKKFSRGGVLAHATTLAKQSGASRTSPILRGNWISEVLLGERLPKPPPGVPPLPDDEAATEGLTVRQLVDKHVSDPKCAVCHRRIDPYGFSLEAFDAIGRHREKDLGDRPVDTRTSMDGSEFEGLDGLRSFLLTNRREAFVRQFCRKLLGYALARAVQLSDEPLLREMQDELAANDYNVYVAVETIVRSRQFREIRGMEMAFQE
jgi:Protein of unknown function (DUF1592)/Protein of unknown function (DUF1588)/Protein of unknown function (DUF1587)/Protein of unknown function (DUF1585)/Protein of unknown function (DUF1595)